MRSNQKPLVLIRPSYTEVYDYYNKQESFRNRHINPPLGLLSLAAYVRDAGGYDVHIIDAEAEQKSPKEIGEKVGQINPAIVGITATTTEIENASLIAIECKKKLPDASVIVGGPHVTALPQESLQDFTAFDIVVQGEGELILKELCDAIIGQKKSLSEISGIYHRENMGVPSIPKVDFIQNFDALPIPAWDLLNMDTYYYPMGASGMQRSAMVQTARGCPNKCIFCFQSFGGKVRFRSINNIMQELFFLKEKKGINFINFVDDTFLLNRKHATALLQKMIESGINLKFKCMTRADTVNSELIDLLKKAGCVRLSMGVESGNDKILKIAQKGTTKVQYRKAYQLISESGIECRASFIIGLPFETLATIADTIVFAKELPIKYAAFNIATPYPGTTLYQFALNGKGYHFIDKKRLWSQFKRWGGVVAVPDAFTKEEMLSLQKYAHAEFYGQPRIIEYYSALMKTLKESEFYFRPFVNGYHNYLELNKKLPPLYIKLKKFIELQERSE